MATAGGGASNAAVTVEGLNKHNGVRWKAYIPHVADGDGMKLLWVGERQRFAGASDGISARLSPTAF